MKNNYEIRGDKVAIFINRKDGVNLETLIDLSDLEKAKAIDGKWYAGTKKTINGYYVLGQIKLNGKKKLVWLHRYLLDPPESFKVDHINHDTLKNTRDNLRVVTHGENMQNRKVHTNSKSGIRGVFWHKSNKKWVAVVQVSGKRTWRYFDTKEAAAEAVVVERKRMMSHG